MSKRPYKTIQVNEVADSFFKKVECQTVVVGIDVAKTKMVAAITTAENLALATVQWEHPAETKAFLNLLERLRANCKNLEVALEPTGTYGDALRFRMLQSGFDVYRVSPLRVSKSTEVFDGVPSSHDGKCAAVIAKLHKDKASEKWPMLSEKERNFKALAKAYDMHHDAYVQCLNRLEAELATYWPEVLHIADLDVQWLWRVLEQVGSPQDIRKKPDKARAVLRTPGMPAERIEEIIAAAKSCGVPMTADEKTWLKALARETKRTHEASQKALQRIEDATQAEPGMAAMAKVVGKATAGVLVAHSGDPRRYRSAAAYEKALGLNLRERSSGTKVGQLHITKRGSGKSRQLLFLAAMRLMKDQPYVRTWIEAKGQGKGWKIKGLVGVMRKLARALWYIANPSGEIEFDISKFIDIKRLQAQKAA